MLQPHSLELQMAAELGVGGVLALLWFCGAIFWACFARRGTLAAEDAVIRVAAAGMFAARLTDTSVDWIYDIPGLTGMAMVAAGLLVVGRSGGVSSGRGRWGRLVGIAALGLAAASAGAYARTDDYANAQAVLELAARREPHNYVPPALLGDLAVRRGLAATATIRGFLTETRR